MILTFIKVSVLVRSPVQQVTLGKWHDVTKIKYYVKLSNNSSPGSQKTNVEMRPARIIETLNVVNTGVDANRCCTFTLHA